MSERDENDFTQALRRRFADAQAALHEGRRSGDDYLVQLSLGEIESFARLAKDHFVTLDGIEESLAPYRLA